MAFRENILAFHQALLSLLTDLPSTHSPLKHLDAVGLMAGDAHHENFGLVPIQSTRSFEFQFNDFDDVSRGPLVVDLIRLLQGIALFPKKGLSRDQIYLLQRATFDHYVQGLLDLSSPDPNDQLNVDHFYPNQKWVEGQNFRTHPELLTLSDSDPILQHLTHLPKLGILPGSWSLLHIRQRTKDYGGSKGVLRYFTLWQTDQNDLVLLEFRKSTPSQSAIWSASHNIEELIEQAWHFYAPSTTTDHPRLIRWVTLANEKFKMRPLPQFPNADPLTDLSFEDLKAHLSRIGRRLAQGHAAQNLESWQRQVQSASRNADYKTQWFHQMIQIGAEAHRLVQSDVPPKPSHQNPINTRGPISDLSQFAAPKTLTTCSGLFNPDNHPAAR